MVNPAVSQPVVLYEVSDGVATVTLNRPEAGNAQTFELEDELIAALRAADDDPAVRSVVLTGSGKHFCVGGDRSLLDGTSVTGLRIRNELEQFAVSVRKPVVAAVNGACVGVGLLYALTCDVRICSTGARFGSGFVRRGLAPGRGMAWLFPRIVGHANATELMLSGRLVAADEAQRMGLVNRVVEPGELLAVAIEWAAEAARWCSPAAMAATKELLYRGASQTFLDAVASAPDYQYRLQSSGDYREGVASLAEKREPNFSGLLARGVPSTPSTRS
jgi:enoyl-CoA hydratase/carnithine racemase